MATAKVETKDEVIARLNVQIKAILAENAQLTEFNRLYKAENARETKNARTNYAFVCKMKLQKELHEFMNNNFTPESA